MVITSVGVSGTALLIASGAERPAYIVIGSGSGTEITNATGLYALNGIKSFTTKDSSTLNKITWISDWNSFEMSGLQLREFGLQTGSPTGRLWHYVNLGNAITFDGTNELRIEITWEVI